MGSRPLLALLLAACASPTIPEGTVRIDPPAEYRIWWDAIAPCVDRPVRRPYAEVRWYLSPEMPEDHEGRKGLALEDDGRIYLWAPWANTPWLIQHELVHAINKIGPNHPTDPFYRCQLMASQHPGAPA